MKHKNVVFDLAALVLIAFVATACGGGGGGGGGGVGITPSIPYSGLNTPAVITSENAVNLSIGAYLGMGSDEQPGGIGRLSAETQADRASDQPQLNTLLLPRIWERAVSSYFNFHPPGRSIQLAQIDERMYGTCDGYADMEGSVNENNGNFSVNVTYQDYSDDCVLYMSGRTNESGNIDPYSLNYTYITITYEALVFTNGETFITQSGTWFIDYRLYPYRETVNIATRDDATGKTYWMNDYVILITTGSDGSGDFEDLNITGRYYDPNHGYVDISNPVVTHFYLNDSWPSDGELKVSGAAGGKALLKWLSKVAYMVEVDSDGDGTYEWNSGAKHWSGTNTPPVANAGANQSTEVGTQVTLDASASSDAEGDILSFNWIILTKPTGSTAALSDVTSINPVFTPDVEGTYELGLTVNDGFETSPMDSMLLNVQPIPFIPLAGLTYRVVDAEYSRQLDRIIMVSSGPNYLHIFNPVTGGDTSISLPLTPNCVSISPDGMFAAVGHNAWVSYINLGTATLVKTIPVTTDVFDVVLAGNGYIYAFPRTDQWETIRCINISTEIETLHTGNSIRAGTKAKLHPGGTSIYGADNGLSPSDIEKYSISTGTAQYLYDSPYHGNYSMAGNLWISDDGLRIFTRSGNVFRASNVQSEDMTYTGRLGNLFSVQSLDHSSSAGKVIVIPEKRSIYGTHEDIELQIYDYDFLVFEHSLVFPSFIVGSASYQGHGRYVFFDSTGTNYFVILQADESSGLLYDYGVVGY